MTAIEQLLQLRHPRNGRPRQTKLYLSQEGFGMLQAASQLTGIDMSAIVDTLLRETLAPLVDGPGDRKAVRIPNESPAPPRLKPFDETERRKQVKGDFDLG